MPPDRGFFTVPWRCREPARDGDTYVIDTETRLGRRRARGADTG